MTWVSGVYTVCPWDRPNGEPCVSTDLPVVRESFDDDARIFVGEQRCAVCGGRMLYSRRPTKAEAKERGVR
jgi:hypothetical protein